MSVLPSFKSAFSSLAEADTPAVRIAEDSGIARSPPHRPWSPLHTSSSDRRAATTTTTPSTRPSVAPLPLDNLVGEAPAFGFARPEKHYRPPVDPLPLEVLGLTVDGLVYVRTESKRATSPAVHAGAYKRPRRHSVSAGGSYVKVSSQPSSERLLTTRTPKLHERSSRSNQRDPSTPNPVFPHPKPRDSTLPQLPPSLSSSAQTSAPSETRPSHPATVPSSVVPPVSSIPRINSLKTSNILSFAPPSFTRSAGSKGQVLSFHTQMAAGAAIIEDSTCRVPIDVLNSPMQRSLNSGGTGRTGMLRGATGHTLTLSRGPTASDLSHLLGPRRNVNEDDVVDGTDALARESHRPVSQPAPLATSQPIPHTERFERERKVGEPDNSVIPKSQPPSREPNPLPSAQQPCQPQPQPPPAQPSPREETNLIGSFSAGDLTFRRTSNPMQENDKLGHVGYNAYSRQPTTTVPQSERRDIKEEQRRPEPWRQQPRPQPINGIVHSQPIASSSRDHAPDYLGHTSSSHLTGPYESREARYTTSGAPTFGSTDNANGARWNHSPSLNGSIGFPHGRRVQSSPEAFVPNSSPAQGAMPRQDSVTGTRRMNGHGGQLNSLLGNDTRDDTGSVQCPHCPRKLRNQVTLQNHIRVVHDHSGNFRCPQCGLTFMWRSTLGNHVRLVHEKQRPYACEQCAKAFRWKSHLREHFWVVHKGEKPFRCETCGKTFGRKNNMQKHMRKHTEGAS